LITGKFLHSVDELPAFVGDDPGVTPSWRFLGHIILQAPPDDVPEIMYVRYGCV
jgi:hypothetical protein